MKTKESFDMYQILCDQKDCLLRDIAYCMSKHDNITPNSSSCEMKIVCEDKEC